MTFWLLSMLAAAAITPGTSGSDNRIAHSPSGDWNFSVAPDSSCEGSASGRAVDAFGATVFIACDATGDLANAGYRQEAAGLRQRRVSLAADLDAGHPGASLWIKVVRGNDTLLFESTTEQSMYEDANDAPLRRSLTVVVPSEATAVLYGVRLQGSGEIEARNLRLTISDGGDASLEAQRVIDAAIHIVRAQTAYRKDITWSVLEPQVRVFAAGATETSDVYPAIQYMLAQLGDRRSLLLKPDIAAMFHSTEQPARTGDATGVFALPDGAKLVLSTRATEPDTRTAKLLARSAAY